MRANHFLGVLGELLCRTTDREAKYSIAVPDVPQFRNLWRRLPAEAKPELASQLSACEKRALWRRLEARFLEDWRSPQSGQRSEPVPWWCKRGCAACGPPVAGEGASTLARHVLGHPKAKVTVSSNPEPFGHGAALK